jgi:parallel beta-helix repeat protein
MTQGTSIGKAIVVGILLIFVSIGVSPCVAEHQKGLMTLRFEGNWLYVGGSGPGNYTRIQDAVDNASDGDTIFVYIGRYYEHAITMNKKISLIGEDRNSTILTGQGKYSEGIHVGSGANVSGFTITSFLSAGLYLDGNNIIISYNIIKWCTQGIFFKDNSYQIEVSNNVFLENLNYGLYLQSAACSIHNNHFLSNYGYAIDVMGGTRQVFIEHNNFQGNGVGIWVRSSRATISRNNFIANIEDVWLTWETTLLTLPFVFYRTPSFRENYWDNWPELRPQVIHGYFRFWFSIPGIGSMLVFYLPIVQFDWHPAQKPYDITG